MNVDTRPDSIRALARSLNVARRLASRRFAALARALAAFDPLRDMAAIVRLVNWLGVGWTTVIVALFSALMSVSIVLMVSLFVDMPNYRTHLALSLVIPLVVSSPFSFLICSALRDLDQARRSAITLARSDVLTGIANRRAFFEATSRTRRRGVDMQRSKAVLFADIDHFKTINDRYGHEAGDAVLKNFAELLRQCTRAEDLIARMGGEEFVAHVVGADPAALSAIANGLLQRVRGSEVDYCGHRILYTVSIGGALGPPSASIDNLLAVADAQLYDVKRNGRNAFQLADLLVGNARLSAA
jgi:diguanylate cyclase (GGDEF)-like protein